MTTFRKLTAFSFLVAASGIGCAVALGDDAGVLEQDQRVNPKGNEGYLTGTVIVGVPKGAPTIAETKLVFTSKVDSNRTVTASLWEAAELPIGAWDVSVPGELGSGGRMAPVYATVDVVGGQTTTVTLPVLAPVSVDTMAKPASPPNVMRFTYGPEYIRSRGMSRYIPHLSRILGNGDYSFTYRNPIGTERGILLLPGGRYEIQSSDRTVLASLDVGTTPKIYKLDKVSDEWLNTSFQVPSMQIHVAMDASDFPVAESPAIDANCAPTETTVGNFQSARWANSTPLRDTGKASTKETIVGSAGTAGCNYSLRLISGEIAIDTKQAQVDLAVHFIDVAHVHVKHNNGSVREVPGKFRLSQIPASGLPPKQLTGFNFATETAIPVAAGTYLIEVSYKTNAGDAIYSEQMTVP